MSTRDLGAAPDISDELFADCVRVALPAGLQGDDDYNLMMLAGSINTGLFRAALVRAFTAGVESVPMHYGVRNPITGGSVYTHQDMSRAGVLRMAAADPTFHEAVCRRQSDWEPVPTEDTNG